MELVKDFFYFASLRLRSLGGIWGHLGSKSKHFQTWTNYIPQRSSWSRDSEIVVFEVIRPPNWRYLGSFGVKIQSFSNLDKFNIKIKLLISLKRKKGFLVTKWEWSTNSIERSERLRRRPVTNCLERSKRLKRRDRSKNYLERSERLRSETGPPIASSEARG